MMATAVVTVEYHDIDAEDPEGKWLVRRIFFLRMDIADAPKSPTIETVGDAAWEDALYVAHRNSVQGGTAGVPSQGLATSAIPP